MLIHSENNIMLCIKKDEKVKRFTDIRFLTTTNILPTSLHWNITNRGLTVKMIFPEKRHDEKSFL